MPKLIKVKTIKKDIRKLSREEIIDFCKENGLKEFNGRQVWEWLWKKGAVDFDAMTNLPLAARDLLKKHFDINAARLDQMQESQDKTIKILFKLSDGLKVEGVIIPDKTRVTACISTQVGCPIGCAFCATGQMGFERNLTSGEIFDQVVFSQKLADERYKTNLSNVVIMGMGEPLLNYDQTIKAINRITSPESLGISTRRITLSTVGIPKMIRRLGDDQVKFNLAISLHSANQLKRNKIIPVSESSSLKEISESLKYFYQQTGTRITIEYLMLGKFNDSLEDAQELAYFSKSFPVKVNIIEYNKTADSKFFKSSLEDVEAFKDYLDAKNMVVNIRRSRGRDIDAACGQLAGKWKK